MGLGAATGPAAVPLADASDRDGRILTEGARTKARRLHDMVRHGRDPLEERDAAKAAAKAARQQAQVRAMTFREVADAYIAAHETSWRNARHRQQWTNTLGSYALPVLGDLPIADVDTGAVMRVLEPIWRNEAETASRLRGRIEAVLDYARARGWREGRATCRAGYRCHARRSSYCGYPDAQFVCATARLVSKDGKAGAGPGRQFRRS